MKKHYLQKNENFLKTRQSFAEEPSAAETPPQDVKMEMVKVAENRPMTEDFYRRKLDNLHVELGRNLPATKRKSKSDILKNTSILMNMNICNRITEFLKLCPKTQ